MTSQSLSEPNVPHPSIGITGQRVNTRVVSVDIFRGLTMIVMIFVNDLASVKGLPWWTYHMPGHINTMSCRWFSGIPFYRRHGHSLSHQRAVEEAPFDLATLGACGLSRGQFTRDRSDSGECREQRALVGIQPNWWAFIAIVGCVLFCECLSQIRTVWRVICTSSQKHWSVSPFS